MGLGDISVSDYGGVPLAVMQEVNLSPGSRWQLHPHHMTLERPKVMQVPHPGSTSSHLLHRHCVEINRKDALYRGPHLQPSSPHSPLL